MYWGASAAACSAAPSAMRSAHRSSSWAAQSIEPARALVTRLARNDRKGCGGVMRVAPVGLFTWNEGATLDDALGLHTYRGWPAGEGAHPEAGERISLKYPGA
jgi:hypothetical protein